MLTAKKNKWFERFYTLYNRNLLKRRFNSVRVTGFDICSNLKLLESLVIYANHSAWWDGLVAFEISRLAKLDSFIMMEEKQLKKLFLFRRLGAFSVVREKPREAIKSINYAAKLLNENSNKTVWIFPQGEILLNDRRPLRFYGGLSRLVEKVGKVGVLPVAIRYEFLNDFKPEIFVKIGKIEKFVEPGKNRNTKNMTAHFAENMTSLLDDLKTEIRNGDFQNFEKII